jgi:flagellar protein FlbD
MIPVTRLDGSTMIVNDDQIAWIEWHPDTVISMMNGEKLLVKETPDELVERTRHFRRSLAATGGLRLAEPPQARASETMRGGL